MIWGESGGGAKTATLTAMPTGQGLYHKASVESSPTLRLTARDEATVTTRQVLAKLGLSEKQAKELVTLPAERFRQLQDQMSGTNPMRFGPVVDGHYLPHRSGGARNVGRHSHDPTETRPSCSSSAAVRRSSRSTTQACGRGGKASCVIRLIG